MSVSYKKLWKLLIDKDMMKKDLQQRANISSSSLCYYSNECPHSKKFKDEKRRVEGA